MTTYILRQIFQKRTKKIVTDKVIRFSSRMIPPMIFVNRKKEVVLSFNTNIKLFKISEARLDIYIYE
jgi:hypothetical protein